jgi:hypothetical protein
MEKLYQIASRLAKNSAKLSGELFKFNPSLKEDNGKESLATLAGIARELEDEYKQLKIDLIQKHERSK